MGTPAFVSVEQYLQSNLEPDPEYVDGEIQERPMGEYDHSTWQQAIEQWFLQHAREWNIRVRCELRVQVTPTRYRVPDVVVFDRRLPTEQVLTHPPIAVFEVLSPEDTIARTLTKLDDYEQMGVLGIFLLDPKSERSYQYRDGDLFQTELVVSLLATEAVVDWHAISALRDPD